MKQLEESKVDQLLGIIDLYPSTRIMHFSDNIHLLSEKISLLCGENDFDYQLNCVDPLCYAQEAHRYDKQKHSTIKQFDLSRPRYATQAKLYDYLFVTCEIPDEQKGSFLQKSYAVIKNAGLILIFTPQGDLQQRHLWSELLQEYNFVATSTLDLFDHYDVVISKKMHGWGG